MAFLRSLGLATLGCVALVGCANDRARVAEHEDLLAAAGFHARAADSPQRQRSLATLPPHRFVREDRGGKPVYVYADPLVCGCLYVGDAAAYGRYRQEMAQRREVDARRLEAQDTSETWDWGPWGPGV